MCNVNWKYLDDIITYVEYLLSYYWYIILLLITIILNFHHALLSFDNKRTFLQFFYLRNEQHGFRDEIKKYKTRTNWWCRRRSRKSRTYWWFRWTISYNVLNGNGNITLVHYITNCLISKTNIIYKYYTYVILYIGMTNYLLKKKFVIYLI